MDFNFTEGQEASDNTANYTVYEVEWKLYGSFITGNLLNTNVRAYGKNREEAAKNMQKEIYKYLVDLDYDIRFIAEHHLHFTITSPVESFALYPNIRNFM